MFARKFWLLVALSAASALTVPALSSAATWFVSPSGSDLNICQSLLPCKSWNAAYQKALSGDTVSVAGGRYGPQELLSRPVTGVTFQVAAGQTATIDGRILVRTHDITISGGDTLGFDDPDRLIVEGTSGAEPAVDFGRGNNSSGVHHVVFEDVHTRNVYMDDGSHDNTFRDGEIGPSIFGGNPNLCADLVVTGDVVNPSIIGNSIHDNHSDGCGGAHIDALDLNVTGAIIKGNRIWWCGTQCVFTGDPGTNNLLEDNMIEETNACGSGCDGPQEVALMGDWTVRWNTIEGDQGYGKESSTDPRPGNANVNHNLYLSLHGSCDDTSGIVWVNYDSNVWAPPGNTCATANNSTACTPRLAGGTLYSDTDRQADYTLAPNDTCALGKAGARQSGDTPPPPPPPAAPECSNGLNDDPAEDALIDFPADPGCSSADDNSELGNPPPPPAGDSTPPSVRWTKPLAGATVRGTLNDPTCEAAAFDNVGVDHVDFAFDGQFVNRERYAPYTCGPIDTSRYREGAHTMTATAYDTAGNSSTATITVNVDNVGQDIPTGAP